MVAKELFKMLYKNYKRDKRDFHCDAWRREQMNKSPTHKNIGKRKVVK